MSIVKGMWLQEPDPSAPDVVVEGEYVCPTCGTQIGLSESSRPRSMSLRTTCCGVDVEIVHRAQDDGSACAGDEAQP